MPLSATATVAGGTAPRSRHALSTSIRKESRSRLLTPMTPAPAPIAVSS
jgi:hypothetical protein